MKLKTLDTLLIVLGFILAFPVAFARSWIIFTEAIIFIGAIGGVIGLYFASDKDLMPIRGVFLDEKYRKKMLRMKGGKAYVYYSLFGLGFGFGVTIFAVILYLLGLFGLIF